MKTLFTHIYNHYSKPLLFLFVLLIVAGHIYNYYRFSSCSSEYEYGLYETEKVNGARMRWTWKRSYLCEIAKTDFLGLTVYAAPYNIDKGGLTLDLFVNDNFLDRVHFVESGSRRLYYYLPDITGKNISLKTEVSRTFNPYKQGLSKDRRKNREQGIAVSPISWKKEEGKM